MSLIQFFLFFICFRFTESTCPITNAKDLLQSGKKILYKGVSSTSDFFYQIPISLIIPPSGIQSIASLSSIADYNSSKGINFFVTARRKDVSNFLQISLVFNNPGAWTSIEISYLISARNDMALFGGYHPSDKWKRKSNSNLYEIGFRIRWDLPKYIYDIAAFISGFSTADTKPFFRIIQVQFDLKSKDILATIECDMIQLPNSLTLNYIIYKIYYPDLVISKGRPKGNSGSYQIVGINSFLTSNKIELIQWKVANRFLTCFEKQCGSDCVTPDKCEQQNGTAYEGKCIFCGKEEVFNDGSCIKKCSPNQDHLDGACFCSKSNCNCPSDKFYNAKTNMCVPPCREYYYFNGRQCTKCMDNCLKCETLSQCKTCKTGYANKKISIQDQLSTICEQICGDGIKNDKQCDDGNNKDGDGCNSKCQLQQGWSCKDGSSTPSSCSKIGNSVQFQRSQSMIYLNEKTILGIKTEYFPQCITKNNCEKCDKILNVTITSNDLMYMGQTKVIYIKNSQYSFKIEFNYRRELGFRKPRYQTKIRLNQDYRGCFTEQDMLFEMNFDIISPILKPQVQVLSLTEQQQN